MHGNLPAMIDVPKHPLLSIEFLLIANWAIGSRIWKCHWQKHTYSWYLNGWRFPEQHGSVLYWSVSVVTKMSVSINLFFYVESALHNVNICVYLVEPHHSFDHFKKPQMGWYNTCQQSIIWFDNGVWKSLLLNQNDLERWDVGLVQTGGPPQMRKVVCLNQCCLPVCVICYTHRCMKCDQCL